MTYNTMVLERSVYSEGFPQEFRLVYSPESKELVIDYGLPDVSIVPAEAEYKYVITICLCLYIGTKNTSITLMFIDFDNANASASRNKICDII